MVPDFDQQRRDDRRRLRWLALGLWLAFFGVTYLMLGVGMKLPSRWLLWRNAVQATGRVERTERTWLTAGEGPSLWRNTFTFVLPDGRRFEGCSYSRGRSYQPSPGATVRRQGERRIMAIDFHGNGPRQVIEYDPNRPQISRIEGDHGGLLPPLFAVLLVFPLVAVGGLIHAVGRAQTRRLAAARRAARQASRPSPS